MPKRRRHRLESRKSDKQLRRAASNPLVRRSTPQQVVQRYASGTRLQAGPGIPGWQLQLLSLSLVRPGGGPDTVRFIYFGPVALFFWRILGVARWRCCSCGWRALSYGGRWRLPRHGRTPATMPAGDRLPPRWAACSCRCWRWRLLLSPPPAAARCARRRTRRPRPARSNSSSGSPPRRPARRIAPSSRKRASTVDGDRLEIVMRVSALANLAVAMPHASDRWQLDEVSVDARASIAMAREHDARACGCRSRRARTPCGWRAGWRRPSPSRSPFPQPPRVIDVTRPRLDRQRRERGPAGFRFARAGA